MYLFCEVVLLTLTVNAYSSHGSAALQIGLPLACEEGFGTAYGPPVNVSGPPVSVRVLPLVGVVGVIASGAEAEPRIAFDRTPHTKAAALADKHIAMIR